MKPKTKKKAKRASGSLSGCYLEHAARETAWAAEYFRQCKYQAAAYALERRCMWLMASMIAKERKL